MNIILCAYKSINEIAGGYIFHAEVKTRQWTCLNLSELVCFPTGSIKTTPHLTHLQCDVPLIPLPGVQTRTRMPTLSLNKARRSANELLHKS